MIETSVIKEVDYSYSIAKKNIAELKAWLRNGILQSWKHDWEKECCRAESMTEKIFLEQLKYGKWYICKKHMFNSFMTEDIII